MAHIKGEIKMAKYLNYSSLMNLKKNGSTEELNEYISFYNEKISDKESDKIIVGELIELLGIDKSVEPIKKFIGVKEITPQSLIEACNLMNVSNDHRIQYTKYMNILNTLEWYNYIVDELNDALGE